jgi:hypothetical protein
MPSFVLKILEIIVGFLWPGKLKGIQIRVSRLNVNNSDDVEDFMDVYKRTFPDDGNNYTPSELLELFEDLSNSRKHVKADNIILVAKYKDCIVGFIACFYYPEKQYGIVGYFGKSDQFKEQTKYVSSRLLNKLKRILVKQHACKLLVFELENNKRDAKAGLFRLFAKDLGVNILELDFEYYRPKMHLQDSSESRLSLMIVPITEEITPSIPKAKVLDILTFIHCYCYGDYYDQDQAEFSEFQSYLQSRVDLYKSSLPEYINAK